LFINYKHLIANVLSATRDADGQLTWVNFLPAFHISLVKQMCTLLSPRFTVACSKWVLFVFLLEILTGNESPKPEVFWHTRKKHSQASQKVCPAMSALTPAPPASSSVPTPLLVPCAQSTSMVTPVSEVTLPGRKDDMSMGSRPAMLTPSSAAPPSHDIHTSANFIKSFPWELFPFRPLEAWLDEAAYRKLPTGHLLMAI
jgi:hypothetical protein